MNKIKHTIEPKGELKELSDMTIQDLHNWILWAENEMSEYHSFILQLKIELKNR